MERIKSKRTAGGGSYSTPLLKWRGLLESFEVVNRPEQIRKSEDDIDIRWRWSNVREVVADPAYPYTTAEFDVKYSDSDRSGWVMLEDSIAAALGMAQTDVSINDLVGCDCLMEKIQHNYGKNRTSGQDMVGWVFKCLEATRVSGSAPTAASAKSPFDTALELLEGKTRTEFMGAAPTNATIKNDGDLINAIMGGAFFADDRVTAVYTEGADSKFVKK
jgi:hypothetical protein|tara:strand:+ start:1568 stop:2221 length:654 start_codon:yes stop_codon:yes gene_type:complete